MRYYKPVIILSAASLLAVSLCINNTTVLAQTTPKTLSKAQKISLPMVNPKAVEPQLPLLSTVNDSQNTPSSFDLSGQNTPIIPSILPDGISTQSGDTVSIQTNADTVIVMQEPNQQLFTLDPHRDYYISEALPPQTAKLLYGISTISLVGGSFALYSNKLLSSVLNILKTVRMSFANKLILSKSIFQDKLNS